MPLINIKVWLGLMVFNATFNNISVISWRSVLFVEETGGSGENHRPVAVTDKLYDIMLYTSPWSRFELTTSEVIGTDYIGSCKSNYHTITATTDLEKYLICICKTWNVITTKQTSARKVLGCSRI